MTDTRLRGAGPRSPAQADDCADASLVVRRIRRWCCRFVAGIDFCLAEPFVDGAFVDSEVLGDLSDRRLGIPGLDDADDVVAEFFRVGLWHGVYPSRLAYEQARLDVT